MYLLYQKRKKKKYILSCQFFRVQFDDFLWAKSCKNDDLRWEMPFCLQISTVNILQSETDKDLKYFIIGTRNLQSRIWIFSQE